MSKTTMPVYDAILAAADAIEQQVERYSFSTAEISGPKCGSPMCAIGWVLAYEGSTLERLDQEVGASWGDEDTLRVLGVADSDFYDRMDAVQGADEWGERDHWNQDADACAATLRKYADRFHKDPPCSE